MKKQIIYFLICGLFSSSTFAQSISSISFLTGCWSASDEDGNKISEDWFQSTANVMLGVSQTKDQNNSMVEHGFLDVHQDEKGSVTYTPTFPGHAPTALTLTSVKKLEGGENVAVFSNPEGVVKKMTYTTIAKDKLNIRYVGVGHDGSSFDFNYDFKNDDCSKRF